MAGKVDNEISIQEFAREIDSDMVSLTAAHPTGLRISHLVDWYGENVGRISRALQILEGQKKIVQRLGPGTHLIAIRLKGHEESLLPPVNLIPLSPLQEKVWNYLKAFVSGCRTNYTQLSRIFECSYGGIRAAITKLVGLKLLRIVNESTQGKQDQLVLMPIP